MISSEIEHDNLKEEDITYYKKKKKKQTTLLGKFFFQYIYCPDATIFIKKLRK